MPYARVDVNILTHEKFLALDPAAVGLWTMGLVYAQAHLTDGHLSRAAVLRGLVHAHPTHVLRIASTLVKVGLWEQDGDGWLIHDYLVWNRSREFVTGVKQKKREAGKAGGQARGKQSAKQDAQQGAKQTASKDEARCFASVNPASEAATETEVRASDSASQSASTGKHPPDPTRPYLWPRGGEFSDRWEPFPHEAVHHDCPRPHNHWRGKCAVAAWALAHPECTALRTSDGQPRTCPAHRRITPIVEVG